MNGPTLADIARELGLSTSTVSRALSGHPGVRGSTRDRVTEVAKRLEYEFPESPTQRSAVLQSIGILVPDLSNPFFAAIAKGAQRRAMERDRTLLIFDSNEDAAQEARALEVLADAAAGVLLCAPRSPDETLLEFAAGNQVVTIHREVGDIASVTADIGTGVHQGLASLAALGHRTVGYIGGPKQSWLGASRQHAVESSSAELGLTIVDLGSTFPDFRGGEVAADLLLASSATAALCFDDTVALGVMHRLASRGVRVPEDISIIGCDDVDLASMATPALTTIDVPKRRAGLEAVDRLLGGPARDTHVRVPTRLIMRSSTGPAPSQT